MKLNVKDYKANEILKFIRQSTGLTQKEFAKKIGKSVDWQQSNEIGRSNLYFKDLIKIAKVFDIDIEIENKKDVI